MVDYAREAVLDLYDAFYELDDIMDYDFDAAMEKGEGLSTQSAANAASGGTPEKATTPVNNRTATTPISQNPPAKNTNQQNDQQDDPDKTKNENAQLKSTSGFVEKLKKIKEFIKNLIEKFMESFQQKLIKADTDNLNKFLEAANKAASTNGLQSIPIENYLYSPQKFTDFINGMKSSIQYVEGEFEKAVSAYERSKNNDNSLEEIKRLSAEMNDSIWGKVAENVGATANGTDPKNILQEFQNSFRNEKEPITIDQAYVDKLIGHLRAHESFTTNLKSGPEATKKLAKTIDTRIDTIIKDPSTTAEINQELNKFTTALGKFTSFTSKFWMLALRLLLECRINCKIVIQRAYNFNFGGAINEASNKAEEAKRKIAARKAKNQNEDEIQWDDVDDDDDDWGDDDSDISESN